MTVRAAIHGKGREALVKALTEHEPFTTSGALKGERWERDSVTNWDLGRLTDHPAWANAFMIDHLAGINYVVWSYGTPIAWVRKDGAVVKPDVTYSVTTSKHQGFLYHLGG